MLVLTPADGFGAAAPLTTLRLAGAPPETTVVVRDAAGTAYHHLPSGPDVAFPVGGALGVQTVEIVAADGAVLDRLTFEAAAETRIEDGGLFGDLARRLDRGMKVYATAEADFVGRIPWRGRDYEFFVPWVLDNFHTARGMQYVSPAARDMVDMFRQVQREDGMIWSRTGWSETPGFWDNAYGPDGYMIRDGSVEFVRQPAENHCEYLYVNLIHLCWKSGGDDAWMAETLDSAIRALDYSVTDRARYSQKYGLLKRAYTIDSWDFQVHDEYFVDLGLGADMRIDPDRTKFGVFFGDNTGYIHACRDLAEMLAHAGRAEEAARFARRADEMLERLNAVSWNGRFFTHRVEEDEAVRRDLGVDEKSQIAHSNMYSTNRTLPHEQVRAILQTYQDLKENLPEGSPGEWYAIYPPFGRGFGGHNDQWQYMNGGIAGHAAGELARGAFEHGAEAYGADILVRLHHLMATVPGDRLWFAYTGAFPTPPTPQYTPVSLAASANMDFWDQGGEGTPPWMAEGPGNDLRGLPVGAQTLAGVPYEIADPAANGRRAAVAVGRASAFVDSVEIPVQRRAAYLYLLHTAAKIGPSGIGAALTFLYDDGSEEARYLFSGQDLTGWWYPSLETPRSGVAWRGPSPVSTDVGICWCALENPHPERTIRAIRLDAALDGATYALAGLTLSDQTHYLRPKAESTGGPDNWAAGTAMGALVEGLVGVTDTDGTTAYAAPRIAPRWASAGVGRAEATIRYAASGGYVAYQYAHDPDSGRITLHITGSGGRAVCHVLLPTGASGAEVTVDGAPVACRIERVERSVYADFEIRLPRPCRIAVAYTV